jgi:hypothetical protein
MTEPASNGLPAFSIVIETATQATSDLEHLDWALASLRRGAVSMEHANEVIVVDTGIAALGEVERVCSRYARVRVHRFEHLEDYFDTKNAALPFVTGEVILFVDSDCDYEPAWLAQMLEPFRNPEIHIVSGETWHHIRNIYDLGVGLAWVLWPFSYEEHLAPARNYMANTVAFRREAIQKAPFRNSGRTHRGGQALHVGDLHRMGYTIWRQPCARAYHPIPGPGIIGGKMLRNGRDAAVITRRGINTLGTSGLWGKRFGNACAKLARLLRQDWRFALALPLALPLSTGLALLYAAGYLGAQLRDTTSDLLPGESPS